MGKTIIISEQQAKRLIVEHLDNEFGMPLYSRVLQESRDLNGVFGINCCLENYDDEEYQGWLQENGSQNTFETLIEYIRENCSFTINYLDEDMRSDGYRESMSYDDVLENFGQAMTRDIVTKCIDGVDHDFEFYEYANDDGEFDLNDTAELNRRAKKCMTVVDSPCGMFRGWILSDGTVLNAGADHNACFKISPTQIKYRESFALLGNVRFSNVSLEFGKYPTHQQLMQVRQFCDYHWKDVIDVDFLGHSNGRQNKRYNGLDYSELCEDLNLYYTYGRLANQNRYMFESVDEKVLYHGSCADFDQFDEKYVLSGVGHMDFGYGFYLTDSKNTAHDYALGGKLYTVEVPDGKYLNANRISRSEAMSVARSFYKYYLQTDYGKEAYAGHEQEFWDYECKYVAEATDGNSLYGSISSILGSDKDTSAYLRSLGYLGLEIDGDNGTTGEVFKNYLIFSQNDIKIVSKTDF